MFMTSSAAADPSASAWASLRQCESSGDYSIDTGNGYYGAYQFDLPTWQSVGGVGSPAAASPAEQDYRALYLYRMRGWSPWTCATLAGLTPDGDAGSGRVPTRADSAYMGNGGTPSYTPVPTISCNEGQSTAPPWGGTDFVQGNTYRALVCWQKQMATRGYGFVGTGYFGPKTFAAVHDLESRTGLPQSDTIDSRVWAAAWGTVPRAPKPTPKPKPKPTPVHRPASRPAPAPVTAPAPAPVTAPAPAPVTAPVSDIWPGLTPAMCHVGAKTAPPWPGESFGFGEYDQTLACWQMQMGHRGYNLVGVGYYGNNTLAAAKDIQVRNNIAGSGLIGPKTWKAAWEGKAKA